MGVKSWVIVVCVLLATTSSALAQDEPSTRRVPLERAARFTPPAVVREGARLAVTPKVTGELPLLVPVSARAGSRVLTAGAAVRSEFIDLSKPQLYCVEPTLRTTAGAPKHFGTTDDAGIQLCSFVRVGTNNEVASWEVELLPQSVPAKWEIQRGYVASFLVIVHPTGSTPAGAIADELVVRLGGEQVEIVPAVVSIGATGVGGAKTIEVTVSRHTDRPKLSAGCFDAEELYQFVEFEVRPHTTTLELTAATGNILGFGLEGTDLRVVRLAEDGLPLAAEPPLVVILNCDSGLLPGSIEIPQGESSVEVSFRSKGQGISNVQAKFGLLCSANCPIEQDDPWVYIGLVAAGGAAGALGRRQVQSRRAGAKRKLASYLFLGSLSAVIVVLGGLYGLNITGLSSPLITTVGGAILIALVVGYMGHATIDRVRLLLLPKP